MRTKAALAVLVATTAAGQSYREQTHNYQEHFHPNGWVFCTLQYDSSRRERDGSGWKTDFPKAGWNFASRVEEVTLVRREQRQGQRVVDAGDPALMLCPLVFTSDVGTMSLSAAQSANLRAYLAKGGVLWVDDFWGSESWSQWVEALHQIRPRGSRIVTPGPDDPFFHTFVRVSGVPQLAHIGYWRQGVAAERGEDSPETPLQVLLTPEGHIAVIMTHNTDIGDTWEQEADLGYFEATAGDGYGLGLNVLIHSMTH